MEPARAHPGGMTGSNRPGDQRQTAARLLHGYGRTYAVEAGIRLQDTCRPVGGGIQRWREREDARLVAARRCGIAVLLSP